MKSGKIVKALACLVTATSLPMAVLIYLRGGTFLLFMSLVIMLGSLLYLFLSKFREDIFDVEEHKREDGGKLWPYDLGFVVLFLLTIHFLLVEIYTLPFYYYFLLAFLAAFIAVEILLMPLRNTRVRVVLTKIVALSFILRFTLAVKYFPSWAGFHTGDYSFHIRYMEIIRDQGHVTPFAGTFYQDYPIFYIFAILIGEAMNLDSWGSLMASTGFFNAFSVVFVYLLAREVFGSRIGLMASLILSISNWHISWSMSYLPGSLAFSFALVTLYLASMGLFKDGRKYFTLATIMLPAVVMTHPLITFYSTIAISSLIVGRFLIMKLIGIKGIKSASWFPLLLGVSMISYWIFPVLSIFDVTVRRLFYMFSAEVDPQTIHLTTVGSFVGHDLFYEQLGLGLTLSLAIYGTYVLASEWSKNLKRTAYAGMNVLTALSNLFFIFFQQEMYIVLGRLVIFIQIITAPIVAVGLFSIALSLPTVKRRAIIVSLLVFLISFTMITTREASFLTPIVRVSPRLALKQSEIRALTFLESHYDMNSKYPSADGYYIFPLFSKYPQTLWKYSRTYVAQDIGPDLVARRISPFGRGDEEVLWLRTATFFEYHISDPYRFVKLDMSVQHQLNSDLNRVFSSSTVTGYHREL